MSKPLPEAHFSRLEVGRKLMWWIPAFCMAALFSAAAILGTSALEAWIAVAIPGKLSWLAIFLVIGLFYMVAAQCGDPFWPFRKRLWTKGTLWIAGNDTEDRLEPFIWDRRAVPRGTDVTEMLD